MPAARSGATKHDDITVLKGSSQSGSQAGPIGPGNFQLARLGGSGADVVRENLAGGFEGCASVGDDIPTQPGNAVGPVAQGLNTRLDNYSGPVSRGHITHPTSSSSSRVHR